MIWWKRSFSSPWLAERGLPAVFASGAGLCAFILVLVMVFLAGEAWPVLTNGGWRAFLWDDGWYPLEGRFGVLPMIWASLVVALGAALVAGPLGLASAIFARFYAPVIVARGYRLVLNLLAGIPSVVYGLWGLTTLVPLIAQLRPPGASLLTAILVVALMVLPTVALTSAAAFASVPRELLAGASALGLTRTGQIIGVVLPQARSGIFSGILLAIARALGETMAVLMVAGNVAQPPVSLLEPVRTITANIALEMAYAVNMHRAGLFASGLLLTFLVVLLSRTVSKTMPGYHRV